VDPATIVAEAIGLAEIDARQYGLAIKPELDPHLPALNVDPILIEQVLLNLVKNGLEAMRESEDRSLRVRVRVQSMQMVFCVVDRGPGVPPEIRDRLFDSFYTTKAEGLGMGLNICRSIIEAHQGRLWFEDNPEGGSLFCFSLPLEAQMPQDPFLLETTHA
jgi:signal transduction histidine kinase